MLPWSGSPQQSCRSFFPSTQLLSPLAQEITLREGKFIIGQDIQPGTYTIKCTETFGDTYGNAYSSLGSLFGDELGGMMGDLINTEVEIDHVFSVMLFCC